jgi:hypothetical protein
MPAPLGDGWPIALCPFGLPDGFLAVHASHSGGGHGDAASVSRPGAPDEPHQLVFEHCSLGALSGAIAVPSVVELQIQRPAGERPTSSEVALAIETVALGFQSRAPPRIDSLI